VFGGLVSLLRSSGPYALAAAINILLLAELKALVAGLPRCASLANFSCNKKSTFRPLTPGARHPVL